jgi:hypothetical protein
VWIRDALLIAEVYQMNEKDVTRWLFVSLKDEALSWASQVLSGNNNSITLTELITL